MEESLNTFITTTIQGQLYTKLLNRETNEMEVQEKLRMTAIEIFKKKSQK